MSEVLVVAELSDGAVTKPTLELLTLARRLGEPVAVILGEGAAAAAATLGEFGATQVRSVETRNSRLGIRTSPATASRAARSASRSTTRPSSSSAAQRHTRAVVSSSRS